MCQFVAPPLPQSPPYSALSTVYRYPGRQYDTPPLRPSHATMASKFHVPRTRVFRFLLPRPKLQNALRVAQLQVKPAIAHLDVIDATPHSTKSDCGRQATKGAGGRVPWYRSRPQNSSILTTWAFSNSSLCEVSLWYCCNRASSRALLVVSSNSLLVLRCWISASSNLVHTKSAW